MNEFILRRYEVPPSDAAEVLELHQLTMEFKQEQHYREDLAAYCETYDRWVAQNQKEHLQMQQEPNLFAWFWRKRDRT